ncbi:MAG: peptidyl-prolyl cis-trans isomerase SurA, partial [Lentimonas sp.]
MIVRKKPNTLSPMMRNQMRALNILCGLLALTVGFVPMTSTAQGQFGPSVLVNNSAVTGYEIDQRAKLLDLFRTPGASRDL